ncbi:hypothetical protein [Dactylosporangium darangshiense]|uniref:Uncharacterized protein n=1 Tax=Dactylosporangium darangshiense TaxID=579108 RepID=A0ABP8DIB6_9ACTN
MNHPDNDRSTNSVLGDGERPDMTDARQRPAQIRRPLATVAAAAVLTVLVAGAAAVTTGLLGGHASTQVVSPALGPTPITPRGQTSSGAGADPKVLIERFAADLTNGPADPVRARFEYIVLLVWDSFAAPSSSSTTPARRIQFWTTGLGASRAVELDETHGCRLLSDQTDDELGPFDGPLSSDPDAVRRQILHEPLAPGTVPDLFGQVGGLYGARFVPLATRQGVLEMLARQPGVGVQPATTDRAGRSGLAVTWTYEPPMPFTVAKTLIFDPRNGQLLASHSRAHRRPDATTPPEPGDEYEIYQLFPTSTYTRDMQTPKVGCS